MTKTQLSETEELWKPIPNFNGYEISNMGRIRSLDCLIVSEKRTFRKKGKILQASLDSKGYKYFKFRPFGDPRNKRINIRIHRIVMEAFNGPSELIVDHINNIRTDNRLSNLQYLTIRQNSIKGKIQDLGRTLEDRNICFCNTTKRWIFSIRIDGFSRYQYASKNKEDVVSFRDNFYKENKINDMKDVILG